MHMRTVARVVICALLFGVFAGRLEGQVQNCGDKLEAITDGRLEHAIEELKAKNSGLEFQPDEEPCLHARDTISALSRTLGHNYLTRLSGYEFVKIINGEGYFTVERFRSRTPNDLTKLEAALKRRTPHKFAIEANTSYEVFVGADSLVLMTSSGVEHEANSNLFHQVQQTFSSKDP